MIAISLFVTVQGDAIVKSSLYLMMMFIIGEMIILILSMMTIFYFESVGCGCDGEYGTFLLGIWVIHVQVVVI